MSTTNANPVDAWRELHELSLHPLPVAIEEASMTDHLGDLAVGDFLPHAEVCDLAYDAMMTAAWEGDPTVFDIFYALGLARIKARGIDIEAL